MEWWLLFIFIHFMLHSSLRIALVTHLLKYIAQKRSDFQHRWKWTISKGSENRPNNVCNLQIRQDKTIWQRVQRVIIETSFTFSLTATGAGGCCREATRIYSYTCYWATQTGGNRQGDCGRNQPICHLDVVNMALSAFSCTSLIGFLEIEKHHATNSQKFKEILVPSSSSSVFRPFSFRRGKNDERCHMWTPKFTKNSFARSICSRSIEPIKRWGEPLYCVLRGWKQKV